MTNQLVGGVKVLYCLFIRTWWFLLKKNYFFSTPTNIDFWFVSQFLFLIIILFKIPLWSSLMYESDDDEEA